VCTVLGSQFEPSRLLPKTALNLSYGDVTVTTNFNGVFPEIVAVT
jgi:hypothetical protein